MNAKAWQENPRVMEMLERVRNFMEEPAPRRVPSDIWRQARNPIARFLLVMAICLGIFEAIMIVATAPPDRQKLLLWAALAAIPVFMALIAYYWLAITRKVLSTGRLYKGKILRVSPLPARINGRWFFSVAVEFDGPGGAKIRGKDTIDNWSSEYFLMARDSAELVDVIYAPNPIGKALLPMKIALGNRYD